MARNNGIGGAGGGGGGGVGDNKRTASLFKQPMMATATWDSVSEHHAVSVEQLLGMVMVHSCPNVLSEAVARGSFVQFVHEPVNRCFYFIWREIFMASGMDPVTGILHDDFVGKAWDTSCSSHYSIFPQLRIPASLGGEILVGINDEGTWMQHERSSIGNFLCHCLDWCHYRFWGYNVGPKGYSKHTETENPLRVQVRELQSEPYIQGFLLSDVEEAMLRHVEDRNVPPSSLSLSSPSLSSSSWWSLSQTHGNWVYVGPLTLHCLSPSSPNARTDKGIGFGDEAIVIRTDSPPRTTYEFVDSVHDGVRLSGNHDDDDDDDDGEDFNDLPP